jgi:serine/threonine protein kinase
MGESRPLESFIGQVLGNYQVVQLLEAHKWGPVFLAQDRAKDQYIIRFVGNPFMEDKATKLTPADRMVTLGHLQREAGNLALLVHPHVVSQADYGTYQGSLYLVYRYLEYTPLRSMLMPDALPDLLRVGRFLEQIASALEYAHDHGVVHRNLSTGCIFVPAGKQIMVGELGLLHLREVSLAGTPWTKGRTYSFEGSTESCAPEQLLGKPVDTYADVYAMGGVLYRMLTGYAPFTGKTRDEILRQHLYAKVPSLNTWRGGLPIDLDHIIAKAMSKEPVERFQRPTALVQAYYQIVAPAKASLLASSASPISATLAQKTGPRKTKDLSSGTLSSKSGALKSGVLKSGVLLKKDNLSRRRFVTVASVGAGAAVLVGAGVIGSRLLNRSATGSSAVATPDSQVAATVATTGQNGHVVAEVPHVPINTAVTFPIAHQENPGILIHLPDNSFVAYDSTCTHEQCEVRYNTQDHLLVCPCHDAIFDPAKNGGVVQGPATRSLTAIKIVVNPNGTITTAAS